MRFGVAVTTSVNPAVTGPAQADYVSRVASAAEEAGYDSVWVSDRTVFPVDLAERYPEMYGPGRSDPDAQNVLEALTTLSFVGGATRKTRLGVSVLVLPFRNPILNAKMITTLDVLSGGRVIFGVGIGWMPEEFEAMGASKADRGAVTDEHIEIFKRLCTEEVAEFQGRHFQTSGMVFFPKPIQKPHPPIWVGGNTQAALRRAARLGDNWHGIRMTPAELAERHSTLRELCREHGRREDAVQVSLRANVTLGDPVQSNTGDRTPLTGTASEIVDDLHRYEDAGLEYLVLSLVADETDSTIDRVRRFADEIAPRV